MKPSSKVPKQKQNFDLQQLMHMLTIQQQLQQQESQDPIEPRQKHQFEDIERDHNFNGIIDQQQYHDHNNMTFSEAKQTNYHNLEEYQQIVQNQNNDQFGVEDGGGFKGGEHGQNDADEMQGNDFFESGLVEGEIRDASVGNIEGQINKTLNNLRSKQQTQHGRDHPSSQVTPQSTIVSSRQNQQDLGFQAVGVVNKLKNKGQIKIHKGLKRSYLVNSKQNSMPPKQGSSVGERPIVKHKLVAPISNALQIVNKKRQSAHNQGPQTISHNIEDQPQLQIVPKITKISNEQHTKNSKSLSKPFKMPTVSNNDIQHEFQALTHRISGDSLQNLDPFQKVQKVTKKGNIILKNNNQVNMKSQNQLYQNQTKSFKKLRKPSHQKHNSIDRAHQMHNDPVNTVDAADIASGLQDQIFGGNVVLVQDDQKLNYHQKQDGVIIQEDKKAVKKQQNQKSSKIISNQRQYNNQKRSPILESNQKQALSKKQNALAQPDGPISSTKQNIHVTHHRHVKGSKKERQGTYNSFDSNVSNLNHNPSQVSDPQFLCNKILQNLNDNFKGGAENSGSSGANKKGAKGSSGETDNSNYHFPANTGFIQGTGGNNSLFINGPVHIINYITSNSKSKESSSNKTNEKTSKKKTSSSKSDNNPNILKQPQFIFQQNQSHTKTFITQNPKQNIQILKNKNQMIYATQDNCNPSINRSANKGQNVQYEPSNFRLQEVTSTPPEEALFQQASASFQQPTYGQILQTKSSGNAGQENKKTGKQSNIYKSFDFYQLSKASKNENSSSNGLNSKKGQQNMRKQKIKQSILENQERQLWTLKGSGGPSGDEVPSVMHGSSGEAWVKAPKSSNEVKNTQNSAFQMFNTEDNRSSFNKNSKKSAISGGPANSGGSGANNELGQNKTSSSNKNTRVRDSIDLRVTKRSNFLNEFDQFEEQFQKHQNARKKVYVNDNYPQSNQGYPRNITNVLSNKVSKESKESKKSKKSQNQTTQKSDPPKQDKGGKQSKNQKLLVNSFMKSQSSDKINQNQNKRDSQNQINQQYDSYMKDYANFTALTKKLLDQKQQIDAQRQCEHCQNMEFKDPMDCPYDMDSANDNQIVGVYKGLEYQQIQHNRAPSYGIDSQNTGSFPQGCKCIHQQTHLNKLNQNRIVSQSKIIIPRGIINFKKGHSVSIERNNYLLNQMQSEGAYMQNRISTKPPQNNGFVQQTSQIQQEHGQIILNSGSVILQKDQIEEEEYGGQIIFNNALDQEEQMAESFQNPLQKQMYSQSQIHSRENSLVPVKQNILTEIDEEYNRLDKNNDYGFNNKINTCVSQASQYQSQGSASAQQQMTMQSNQRTFMLEPREESLMRKKKVIEILKSFQQPEDLEKNQELEKANQKKNKKKVAKVSALCYNFGEQFDFIENKIPPQEPPKKKSHSNVPLSLESFKNELQNHTYYVGKPIIIQQQNRVKKNNKNTRRRDQQPEEAKVKKEKNIYEGDQDPPKDAGLMNDLNDFMMIEDLKIDEQEEKFIQQAQFNQQRRQLVQDINNSVGVQKEKKRNIGSFDDDNYESEQKNLENDLGVDFVGETANEVILPIEGTNQDSRDLNDIIQPGILHNLLPQSNPNPTGSMNLQNLIKNIDSIFEPEPETPVGDSRKKQE